MRSLVIIDGSNFYHKAKALVPTVHLSTLNYRKLFEDISGSETSAIEYCVGEIKLHNSADEKARKMYAGQQALFYHLQKQRIVVKKGFMLKNAGIYHEKGVDVRIAIDIVRGSLKDEYDVCYVVSSDSDILPAIRDALDVGKKVVYVAFEGSTVSRALAINCSYTKFITKNMLEQCVL